MDMGASHRGCPRGQPKERVLRHHAYIETLRFGYPNARENYVLDSKMALIYLELYVLQTLILVGLTGPGYTR